MRKYLTVSVLLAILMVFVSSCSVFTKEQPAGRIAEAASLGMMAEETGTVSGEITVKIVGTGEKGEKGDPGPPGPKGDKGDPVTGGGASVDGVHNVKDYGAVGDAVTDDTPAIKAAIAAAKSRDVILFPRGTYVVTETLINAKNLIFQGISPAASRIYQKANAALFDTTGAGYCRFERLHLASNATRHTVEKDGKEVVIEPALIRFTANASHCTVSDVFVTGSWYSIHLRGALFTDLIRIMNAHRLTRIQGDKATLPTNYAEVHIFGERYGSRAMNDIDIVSCKFQGGARIGVWIKSTNSEGGVTIRDSLVEAHPVCGIRLSGMTLGSVIDRVHLEGQQSNIELLGCSNTTVTSNFAGGSKGLIMRGCRNIIVEGNYLWDIYADEQSKGLKVCNNDFQNASGIEGCQLKQSDNFCTRNRSCGLCGKWVSPLGQNLVEGDLEEWSGGFPKGFTGYGVAQESEIKKEGSYSAKVTGVGGAFGLRFNMVPKKFRGRRVTVRFSVYKPAEDGVNVRVLVYYNNWGGSTATFTQNIPVGEWVELTYVVNLPEFGNAFILIGNIGKGHAFIDCVEIVLEG